MWENAVVFFFFFFNRVCRQHKMMWGKIWPKMASFVPALHQDVAMAEETSSGNRVRKTPSGNRVRERHRAATELEIPRGNRVRKKHRAATE